MNIHMAVYTYSEIKSHTKPYKIFDFKSGHSTFYKAIKNCWDVSSKQLPSFECYFTEVIPLITFDDFRDPPTMSSFSKQIWVAPYV